MQREHRTGKAAVLPLLIAALAVLLSAPRASAADLAAGVAGSSGAASAAASAAAAGCAGAVSPSVAPAAEDWDPYLGMEPSGRIPAVEKDVQAPARWRYIPEGRIMPGGPIDRFLVSTFAAPVFFRDEDIGVGAGLGFFDIDFRGQRRREFAGVRASFSSEGQQRYGVSWRRWLHTIDHPAGGVLQEERTYVKASGGYSKTLSRRFFGLGDDSREQDETSYEDEAFDISARLNLALPEPGGDWILRVGLRGELHQLSPGSIDDVPTTDELFPELFDAAENSNLGFVELGMHWDTRDSQANPYAGWRIGGDVNAALLQRGGDMGAILSGEVEKVFSVPPIFHSGGDAREENPPTDTIVVLFETATTVGDLPFYALPALGGSDRLRGYTGGRYRDRSSYFLGTEWRAWVLPRGFHVPFTRAVRVERVGIAPFLETGSVADEWTDLFSSRVHANVGVGLRVALERAAIFRVDLGYGSEGTKLSIRFGLAY